MHIAFLDIFMCVQDRLSYILRIDPKLPPILSNPANTQHCDNIVIKLLTL